MANRFYLIDENAADPRQAALLSKVRKYRRKGEARKALVALREACLRDEQSAWLWTLYGAHLAEAGQETEAEKALRHAIWLRRGSNDRARLRSTQMLLERIAVASRAA